MYKEKWSFDKMVEENRAHLRSSAMTCYTVAFTTDAKKGEPCNEFNSGFYAEDNNGNWGMLNNGKGKHIVIRKQVMGITPYHACRKLEEWQQKGLPDEFLMATV